MKSGIKKQLMAAGMIVVLAVTVLSCGNKSAQETTQEEITTVEPAPETMPATIPGTQGESKEHTTEAGQVEESDTHKIIIASDIHYLSDELNDHGEGFMYAVNHGDGRVVQYCHEILDAWKEDVIKENPEVVILSGDLTYNGEYLSHCELAAELADIEIQGIPVIVIPGNHDINNAAASAFSGTNRLPARRTTASEFYQIYQDYGYQEAVSRDPYSLSYVWQLDEYTRIMMIDDNQYEPFALVGGMIKEETYDWIEQQYEEAWNKGIQVIPVSHHNVLDESEVYVEDCTIEHSEKMIDIVEGWQSPLYLSGHLHVQHFKKSSDNNDAFYEIVTGSLTTPPCCYAVLDIKDDGEYKYKTVEVDMNKWAIEHDSHIAELIDWNNFKNKFLGTVFTNQAYAEYNQLELSEDLDASDLDAMAHMYANVNIQYYAGRAYTIAEEIKTSLEYSLWMEQGYESEFVDNIEFIIRDAIYDYNNLNSADLPY